MKPLQLLAWIALGALGVALLVRLYPVAAPFAPAGWEVNQAEARAIALERFRDLGEPVERPYVVSRLASDPLLERRLLLEAAVRGRPELARGELARRLFFWEILVYPRGAGPRDWTYRAAIGLRGELLALRLRLPDDQSAGVADPNEARQAADLFLRDQGFDLDRYTEPEVRSQQLRDRTDSSFRYRLQQLELGPRFPYGVEVRFAGDRLTGFQDWLDDPERGALQATLQPLQFVGQARNLVVLLFLPLVAVPFLRRYHAGEIGVKRGLQIGGLVLALALVAMAMTAEALSEGSQIGFMSRVQLSWFTIFWTIGFIFLPVALMTVLTWSVGESLCRVRWSEKLAAFDALFQRSWKNATVARSALRGTAAGAVLAALLQLVALGLQRRGVAQISSLDVTTWWFSSHWPALVILSFFAIWALYGELFGRLLLVPLASARLGPWGGGAVAAIAGGVFCWGPWLSLSSTPWLVAIGVLSAGYLVVLFLRYDLLTSLTASFISIVLALSVPLLRAADPWLQFQGSLVAIGAALPLLVSIRAVASRREFVYRYDDVPPHVRRITERERQRVELETARRIQSSILPELPPQLNGVKLAHSYLPATEVGGDFYDVMALEDGRLAVAVGDVAGHGVSSGLVMSMAKSALAVQVTFNPEVRDVFRTLNRMVYQSARRRLLTTLCYVLIDPGRHELHYASAGHLFPYRITGAGRVVSLESVSYPLGVRETLDVHVRVEKLESGDLLFLFSDGVVEACPADGDEPFGFERLERSLLRHAGAGVAGLRDGVLDDLGRFTGSSGRQDDLTILALQIP